MTEEATERVTMLWPAPLKKAVREQYGARGITAFTIEAVQARLAEGDLRAELNEARTLVQELVDAIATGGDYEDRQQTLANLDLPDWVRVDAAEVEDEDEPVPYVPVTADTAPLIAGADIAAEEPVVLLSRGDKLLVVAEPKTCGKTMLPASSRIKELAQQYGLTPASEIDPPAPRANEDVDEEPPVADEDDALSDTCPNCMSPLVGGECWTCD